MNLPLFRPSSVSQIHSSTTTVPPATTTERLGAETAAVKLQRAWRRFEAENKVTFSCDGSEIVANRALLFRHQKSPRLTAELTAIPRALAVVPLLDMSLDTARRLVQHLEGRCETVPAECASALRQAAANYDDLELQQECERVAACNAPTTTGLWATAAGSGASLLRRAADVASYAGAKLTRLFGFEESELQTSVGRVHVVRCKGTGPGPRLIVVHGISCSVGFCAPFLLALRKHFKEIVAFDLPGHGQSELPTDGLTTESLEKGLTETLERLFAESPERPVLFGNSMGGLIVLHVALRYQRYLSGLVLASPAGAALEPTHLEHMLQSFSPQGLDEGATFAQRLFAKPLWWPLRIAVGAAIVANLQRPELQRLLTQAKPDHFLDCSSLRKVRVPVRLLWGERERVLPRENLVHFQAAWRKMDNVRIVEPPGMGHFPAYDDPEGLATEVGRIVEQLDPREVATSS